LGLPHWEAILQYNDFTTKNKNDTYKYGNLYVAMQTEMASSALPVSMTSS
jgi:hypothetical protein